MKKWIYKKGRVNRKSKNGYDNGIMRWIKSVGLIEVTTEGRKDRNLERQNKSRVNRSNERR